MLLFLCFSSVLHILTKELELQLTLDIKRNRSHNINPVDCIHMVDSVLTRSIQGHSKLTSSQTLTDWTFIVDMLAVRKIPTCTIRISSWPWPHRQLNWSPPAGGDDTARQQKKKKKKKNNEKNIINIINNFLILQENELN